MKSTEKRLINLAQMVAFRYKERISPERYDELCKAIEVCNDYYLGNSD